MFRRYEIANVSMVPALQPGDYVLAVRRTGRPVRGEVIVYAGARFELVKRIVGLPGETVRIAGGVVRVDETPLDEPWASSATSGDGVWQLDDNEVFVLGDQRTASSEDSRQLGPLPAAPRYVVIWRYWPRDRIGPVRA